MSMLSALPIALLGAALIASAIVAVWWTLPPPTPAPVHAYVPEQSRMPAIEFEGEQVHVRAVRSFVHGDTGSVEQRWVDRTYDLSRVESVWFVLARFARWRAWAHAFLSFQLADSRFVSISVEARKDVGEVYNPLSGMRRQYELIAVIGDEPDVIGLRTHVWGYPVYLYPTVATSEQARKLFVVLLERAEQLRTSPEYYHTLRNNCATNLADAINRIRTHPLGWTPARVFPGYLDSWAWAAGLLALEGPIEKVRSRYRINEKAEAAWGTPDFSWAIRSRAAIP